MGKILLCSNAETLNKIKENIPDFSQNGNISGSFGHLTTFHKLRIQTQNIYSESENFAAGTGTFLYKGKIGKEALACILKDFCEKTFVREAVVGSYCLLVYTGEKVCLFVDPASTYNIHYHVSCDQKEIILTNTYYHVAMGMEQANASETGMVDAWLRKTVDRTTPVEGVYKLMGNECLVYEGGKWNTIEMNVSVPDDDLTVSERALQIYQGVGDTFTSTGVFMTGGQDSRISLALMLALGMKPTLYYGIGNSSNTSTKTEDMDIVKQIAQRFQLPVQTMNWNESDEEDREFFIRKYGEWFALYRMNKNVFHEFESNIQAQFVALGYFGEVFRTIEPIEAYAKTVFSLDEYLDDIYLRDCKAAFSDEQYSEMKNRIKRQLSTVCAERGICEEQITKDQFQILNTVYRQRWDTLMNNFANQFMYSIPLFGNILLTRKTEAVSYEKRLKSKHLMETMYALCPALLDIPFFSHIKVKSYDPITHELTNKEFVSDIKDVIRGMIRSEKLMRLARSVYYLLRGDKKGRQETAQQYAQKEMLLEEYRREVAFSGINVDKVFQMLDARGIKEILLMKKMMNTLCK